MQVQSKQYFAMENNEIATQDHAKSLNAMLGPSRFEAIFIANMFCSIWNKFWSRTFFLTFLTFFELYSTPKTTTKLLLGHLSIARGQR